MAQKLVKRRGLNVSATLKVMEIGDQIFLSAMYAGAARAAASRLRKSQMLFRVEKECGSNKLTVTRTA